MIVEDVSACQAAADTRLWVERAVIGLNLCPFAKAVQIKGQVRYAVSDAVDEEGVLADLEDELMLICEADPDAIDTTLLILPEALHDFYAFNDFGELSDRLLKRMRLVGSLQVATFHPAFQFADTDPRDMGNYTNRSPYPTLHILREDSLDRAVEAFPEAETIYERNIETMESLGIEGWRKLMQA
ncbi:DUF1415 domain-containing protein [Bordetella sp. FB-8]|uniref:DUF1415 domain-containing protein n=1 Tax=Bordetella sp. FB-8 TaxID=1159870 RepID=UPI000368D793|nr:DUF1415 domain-containing protein [Bordetella sp. FB-8]